MKNTRELIIETLEIIFKQKLFFSEAKKVLEIEQHQDLPFINTLVLTTLRHKIGLQKILHSFIARPHKGAPYFADFALLAATAELLFLETPDYAVLNSYIEIIKKHHNKYIANFSNAVLRNILRNKEEILKDANFSAFFSKDYTKILKSGYTPQQIKKIEQASQKEPLLDITLKNPQEASSWVKELNGQLLPNGSIRLKNSGKISKLKGYQEGAWWVQDMAASLAVSVLGKIKGQKILDICAAPGGKTAQLISRGAQTTALDISQERLHKLSENLNRLNLKAEEIICADALDYLQNTKQPLFDSILLDAPCSATGTLRRHPEIVHLKTLKDVQKSTLIQKTFLENIGKALKVGGHLVYTVCSIAPQEGEQQISEFLTNHPDYKLIPIQEKNIHFSGQESLSFLITPQGFLRTLPYYMEEQGGMDAFFVALLKKVK